ncbi:MAG: UDP binding domain-containing protein, partial [bacterium]
NIFHDKISYVKNNYEALNNADALILITEWNEFRRPDFEKMKKLMKTPVIFDGRNQYEPKRMKQRDFDYICVGKPVENLNLKKAPA